MSRPSRDLARFVEAMQGSVELAEDPDAFEARAPEVSEWSVGLHLEHLLLVDRGLVDWLSRVARGEEVPPPEDPEGGPTAAGHVALLIGRIPRGRGRAPDGTVPEGRAREEVAGGLAEVVERARRLADGIGAIRRSEARMSHPALGTLDAAQWLRFARVHQDHHGRIVRDVLRAGSADEERDGSDATA